MLLHHHYHTDTNMTMNMIISLWYMAGLLRWRIHIPPMISFLLKCTVRMLSLPSHLSAATTRLAHTLTPIPGKAIVLIGGITDGNECGSMQANEIIATGREGKSRTMNESMVLHYGWDNEGQWIIQDCQRLDLEYISSSSSSSSSLLTSDAAQLSCQKCHGIHQVIIPMVGNHLNGYQSKLWVLGGGAMTLAFGEHYCTSLEGKILMKNVAQRKFTESK